MRRWKPIMQIIVIPIIAIIVVMLVSQGRSFVSALTRDFGSAEPTTASVAPTATPEPPTSTPEPPTATPEPTVECEGYSADGEITASAPQVKVGETLQVTATLRNIGECGMLGLPRYTLETAPDGQQLLANQGPDAVTNSLGLSPGESDAAVFTLQAQAPGSVELSFHVSFEAHLGYPGPATWGGSGGGPITVEVVP